MSYLGHAFLSSSPVWHHHYQKVLWDSFSYRRENNYAYSTQWPFTWCRSVFCCLGTSWMLVSFLSALFTSAPVHTAAGSNHAVFAFVTDTTVYVFLSKTLSKSEALSSYEIICVSQLRLLFQGTFQQLISSAFNTVAPLKVKEVNWQNRSMVKQ